VPDLRLKLMKMLVSECEPEPYLRSSAQHVGNASVVKFWNSVDNRRTDDGFPRRVRPAQSRRPIVEPRRLPSVAALSSELPWRGSQQSRALVHDLPEVEIDLGLTRMRYSVGSARTAPSYSGSERPPQPGIAGVSLELVGPKRANDRIADRFVTSRLKSLSA